MRILHVITTLDRGGAENHLVELATAQKSLGHDVDIAYLQGSGFWCSSLAFFDIASHPLKGSSKKAIDFFISVIKLRHLIIRKKPDVVHAHLPPAEIVAYLSLCNLLSGINFVVSKHVDSSFFSGSNKKQESILGRIVGSLIIGRTSSVICISRSVLDYVIVNYSRKALLSKACLIYYGIDKSPFQWAALSSAKTRHESDIITIGTAARFVPQKALDILLQSFAIAMRETERIMRIRIAGDGPQKGFLQELAIRLGISHMIEWCGKINDMPAFMASLDIFILTSKYEGLGLVLLEAMAAGVPVVASNTSAIPEIVINGKTGILCDPGDCHSFSKAVLRLALNKDLRLQMGQEGCKRASEVFSVNNMLSATMNAYSSRA